MRKSALLYCLLTGFVDFLCIPANSYAQEPEAFSYQYYNTSHGLPSSEVLCLAKDHKGFLWIGTSAGLSMYDGYIFQNHNYTKNGELIGSVYVIKQDQKQRLWIGSGAGLFCLANNQIIKISEDTRKSQGVNDIAVLENIVWLATESGPVKLSLSDIDFSGTRKINLPSQVNKEWFSSEKANGRTNLIATAPDNTIFFAQEKKLFKIRNERIELLYTTIGAENKITALIPVNASTIFFDTDSLELCKYENGSISIPGLSKFYQPVEKNNLPGRWYMGTRGAFLFHPQTGLASKLISFSDKYTIWASAILEDKGFYWVGTHDGLVKLKPSLFTHYDFGPDINTTDYYSIAELKSSKLLLGANFGRLFEKKGASFQTLKEKVVPRAELKSMYEDEDGTLWIASGYQGMVVMKNNQTERFTVADGLHDNSLHSFLKTSNGKFYVIGDQGISEIISTKNKRIHFKPFCYPPNITTHAKFFAAIEGPGNKIWIGGEEGLACFYNDSLFRFELSGKSFPINGMIKDKNNNLWIASSGQGILQVNFNDSNIPEITQQFKESDGLNSNDYLSLATDAEGNIWTGSSKGLSVIGQQGRFQNRILNFTETDGFLKAGYSYMRLYHSRDSTMWGVSSFGITSFKPNELPLSESAPIVYFKEIRNSNLNQILTDRAVAQDNRTNQFTHSDNSFEFHFAALDYASQDNIRYYYQLEGLDTNWKNTEDVRSVSIENLSPGNYTMRVRAMNEKGIWSKQDAVYAFTIAPPFWYKWWFLLPAIAGLCATVFFIAFRRIRFVRDRESAKADLQQLKASRYKEQLEIEQIINHFATNMNTVNNIDDVLWNVAENCISRLNFEDCVIYLKDINSGMLVQKAAWGPKTSEANKIINPIAIAPGAGIVGAVAASGIPEIVNDTSLDDRYITDDKRRFSEITVPIVNNGQVIGIIDSEHSQKNFYTQRHLQILTTIASLCGGKIETLMAEQHSREKEMEVLRLNRDFATSQLTALRMQMNPHFIFNALNSVQHYMLQGNVIEANKYLSKFSKLQREILHCSSEQFITLEKEIEILSQYLDLEQYRFGESFVYHINLTDEIEPAEIKIPPMVLQPFVENAIWHGLMPRQADRRLSIHFDLYSEDILLATLRDNGIGRAASGELKTKFGREKNGHESKGMSMVEKRLQLLQQQYEKPFEVAISDINDINGVVQGTQVALKIFIGNKRS